MTDQNFEVTLSVSSALDTVSNDGSTVTTRLQPGIVIPSNASDVSVALRSSFMFNSFPNVDRLSGNTLYIRVKDSGTAFFKITFPDGQYEVSTLDDALQSLIANDPLLKPSFTNCLQIIGNPATQTIALVNITTSKTIEISFIDELTAQFPAVPLSIYRLLGFTGGSIISIPPQVFKAAPNTANFNTVNIIRPVCSLLSAGIRIGGISQAVLADIPINNLPGSQLVYLPAQALKLHEPGLRGQTIRDVTISLTNEKGEYIRTIGNDWTINIVISYILR